MYKYLIIMTRESSSCNTLSKYIISRSDTIAPLITIISSPLIIPDTENNYTWNNRFIFQITIFKGYDGNKSVPILSFDVMHYFNMKLDVI